MVADDDKAVRAVAQRILERRGFRVITAVDGLSAVKSFRSEQQEIILVLLDVTMPGLSGPAAASEIRRIRSDIPVVLTSGYLEEVPSVAVGRPDCDAFLHKPYRPEELVACVRSTLTT